MQQMKPINHSKSANAKLFRATLSTPDGMSDFCQYVAAVNWGTADRVACRIAGRDYLVDDVEEVAADGRTWSEKYSGFEARKPGRREPGAMDRTTVTQLDFAMLDKIRELETKLEEAGGESARASLDRAREAYVKFRAAMY